MGLVRRLRGTGVGEASTVDLRGGTGVGEDSTVDLRGGTGEESGIFLGLGMDSVDFAEEETIVVLVVGCLGEGIASWSTGFLSPFMAFSMSHA